MAFGGLGLGNDLEIFVTEEAHDHLKLATNHAARKMLWKKGKNLPNPEVVLFSDFVVKVNRRGKRQRRVMLVTDRAIYNLVANNYGKCRRRIDLSGLLSITISKQGDEFVLHVPEEYDYHYDSPAKGSIVQQIKKGFHQTMTRLFPGEARKLIERETDAVDLKKFVLTRKERRKLKTSQAIEKRKRELAPELFEKKEPVRQEPPKEEKNDRGMTQLMSGKYCPDDFELLKVIGRGSFGKVIQVRKKDDGQIFAMKTLKKKNLVLRRQVEHTNAERHILQQLKHPFLMKLRFAFQTDAKLYLVLDYYKGGELFFHLKKKRRFPEDVVRIYIAEIALALAHLHSLKVVYRDLKPENVLLDEQGHICLTDFGLSQLESDLENETTNFCGTPEYLAPEIIAGAGHDKAVDWWSLGVLLYELTVGLPPFYSTNVNEMYAMIQRGKLRFPPFLSQGCKSCIVKLLHRDPKLRMGSADGVSDLMMHPWFDTLDWNKLLRKEIDVPYKPMCLDDTDTSNFDRTFTSEPVVDSLAPDTTLPQGMLDDDTFGGFTFGNKSSMLR